ncbi:hypothetical protein HPB51_002776 [Rhipicephalus microplus]|uniref:RNA-dependent RNA polymerase n=1 Tax=Rhipicephalus microplus TaxID=6941 RepID=A0A9J6D8H1_RHIMP|nr:RNA-dependent RNA polymerase 1-like [Rhipicephalus microplus]KAH8018328.1 hypothetical protein HPB51_002776 [Rhipicephalus microplus]
MANRLSFLVMWKHQGGERQDYISRYRRFFTTVNVSQRVRFHMSDVVVQSSTHSEENLFQAVCTIKLLDHSASDSELSSICSSIAHQWCFLGKVVPFKGHLQWLIPDRERGFWRETTPYETHTPLEYLAFGTFADLCVFAQSHVIYSDEGPPAYSLSCAFKHDERLLQVLLLLNHSHGCRQASSAFKLEIPYGSIFRVVVNEVERNQEIIGIYLQLTTTPLLYLRSRNPGNWDTPNASTDSAWFNRVFQLGCPCFWLMRSCEIGASSVIKLSLKNKLKERQAISCLTARCKRETTFQYSPMTTCKISSQLKQIKKRCNMKVKPRLGFSACYALSAVLQQGNDAYSQMALLARDKLEQFEEDLVSFALNNSSALEAALFAIRSAIEEHEVVDIIRCLPKLYAKFCRVAFHLPKTPSGTRLVRRSIVTPSKVLLLPPQLHNENRILRKFDPEYSLRVSFRDDNLQHLSYSLMSGSCRHMAIERVVTDTLRHGLTVGDRQFKLLASSCSQLRDHGAWFYATDGKGYSTDMIRYWMGDFSGISSTAKKMARMGQCFSSTEESVIVSLLSDSVLEVPDVLGGENSVTNEQYIFSDGIGMISSELLKEVQKKLKLLETPSAIQIRYAGYKGMLCLNPSLPGRQLVLRKSMRKFNCVNSENIEVIKISAPRVVFLNRQLITLLEQLGVPSRMFFCLQQHMVTLLTESLVCDTSALQVLDTYVGSALPFNQLARHGFSLTRDPFVRSMLFAVYRTSMESLLSKSRIAVPHNLGRNMFGVLDETRTLQYGEVFVQYTSLTPKGPQDDGPETTVLTGTVLVTKCPCLHPGDVRKFTAVNVTSLHHIKDCIVFPANGHRPHPDEMAGSDLDGDEYIVIWDENFFFPGPNREPMVYGQKLVLQQSEPNLVDSMAVFISNYILNDNVGVMSNAHLALADKLEDGVFSKPCLSVAKKISTCLDFAKTGVPALLERNEKPEEYPDFMDKGGHKNAYRSARVLGHLYRFQRFLESVVSSNFNSHLIDSGSNIKLLELHGWKRYQLIVEELLAAHESDMDRILKQYGIKSEAEIVSGYINDVSASNKGHYEKSNVEVLVAKQYRVIVESTRQRFFEEVDYACRMENALSEADKKQILLRMASACFMVTYYNAKKTYSSFPWSFADVIILVMEESSSMLERTSKNLLVYRLDNQLAASASRHSAKIVALEVVLKWADKEDLILKTAAVNCARICENCLQMLFAKSALAVEREHAENDPENRQPPSTGYYVTSFLRYVSSSSVVFPECDACSQSSQMHTLTMAALRTYSMLSILCDLCHLGLPCDESLHEPIQEIKEGNSVRIKVSNPALWDMLVHSQDEVAGLLCSWSGVKEVRIRRGADRCTGHYIVVSSIGRDWQRWFLEELLLQPWLARAILTRSLAEFIRA